MTKRRYPEGYQRALDWADLDAALVAMTAAGVFQQDIADELGVGLMSVRRRQSFHGIRPGQRGKAPGVRNKTPRKPEHTAALLASREASGAYRRALAARTGKPMPEDLKRKIALGQKRAWAKRKAAAPTTKKPYLGIFASTGSAVGRATVSIHAGSHA